MDQVQLVPMLLHSYWGLVGICMDLFKRLRNRRNTPTIWQEKKSGRSILPARKYCDWNVTVRQAGDRNLPRSGIGAEHGRSIFNRLTPTTDFTLKRYIVMFAAARLSGFELLVWYHLLRLHVPIHIPIDDVWWNKFKRKVEHAMEHIIGSHFSILSWTVTTSPTFE